MIEIERKFLVNSTDFKKEPHTLKQVAQGYLNSNPDRTVRIRIAAEKGYITIKGKGNASGMSRFEWEKEIPLEEAKNLLQLCEPGIIKKTRYAIPAGGHVFEVDEFLDENQGLVVAEIELSSESESFEKPQWLGKEVTNDQRYYNAWLSKNPYTRWQQ